MASREHPLLTPGWSTSKPGDMKNSTGMATKFAIPVNRPDFTPRQQYEVVPQVDPDVPQTGMDEVW